MDNAPVKVKNNESGTITAQVSVAEVTSITLDPVPQYAPGVLVMSPGTEEEEHIFFRKRDAVGGTVSGLIRDITNLNGGSGFLHINGTSWESMQASEYINFIVEAMIRGWMVEPQIIAYVSGTSFTVQGNQTDRYTVGRFLRIDENDAKIAVVDSSSYSGGTGLTTVVTRGFAIPNPLPTIEVQIAQPTGWTGNMPIFYGEDAGGDDTYAVTIEPDFGAYFKGMIILFAATTANTGACTLNINAIGAVDIKTIQGNDPLTGEILAGHMVMVVYNGTNFRLLSSSIPGAIDEDDMTSDSAVRVPTQQSVKAYAASMTTAQTLTNKRITKRVGTIASSATPTPSANDHDVYTITALATAAEIQNPSGTPTNGQTLILRIKDNGTARALTYGTEYRALGNALPPTTVLGKTLYLGLIFNSTDTKWDLIATAQEA